MTEFILHKLFSMNYRVFDKIYPLSNYRKFLTIFSLFLTKLILSLFAPSLCFHNLICILETLFCLLNSLVVSLRTLDMDLTLYPYISWQFCKMINKKWKPNYSITNLCNAYTVHFFGISSD